MIELTVESILNLKMKMEYVKEMINVFRKEEVCPQIKIAKILILIVEIIERHVRILKKQNCENIM